MKRSLLATPRQLQWVQGDADGGAQLPSCPSVTSVLVHWNKFEGMPTEAPLYGLPVARLSVTYSPCPFQRFRGNADEGVIWQLANGRSDAHFYRFFRVSCNELAGTPDGTTHTHMRVFQLRYSLRYCFGNLLVLQGNRRIITGIAWVRHWSLSFGQVDSVPTLRSEFLKIHFSITLHLHVRSGLLPSGFPNFVKDSKLGTDSSGNASWH